MDVKSKFMFDCHKGLSCYTKCCRDVNIFLTPYDILRIKKSLNMSSEEFLDKYTVTIIAEKTGLPVVLLKMDENTKECPFVTDQGCKIYAARPWSCRMYPLDGDEDGGYRFITNSSRCFGLNEQKEWKVGDWLEDQGLGDYDKVEKIFNEISAGLESKKQKITNPKIIDMFYITCYNVDKFRRFVFESSFLDVFDIGKEAITKIKTDEVELLKFGFQWIKFGLIENKTFKIKDEAIEARRKKIREY